MTEGAGSVTRSEIQFQTWS